MATALASYINYYVQLYDATFGTNLANTATGTVASAAYVQNIITTTKAAAAAAGYDVNLPDPSSIQSGQTMRLVAFGTPVKLAAATPPTQTVTPVTTRWSTAGSYPYTVPAGVTSVQVNWLVGPGGGGGNGSQNQNGGGGGGGGSGGFVQNQTISVNPGDVLTISIGSGGQGGTVGAGSAGGVTTIARNGAVILTVTGGQGGSAANTTKSAIPAPGGLGGAFQSAVNGLTGQTGPGGTSDTASSYGGAGAPGPVEGAFGGAGGTTGGGDAATGSSAGSKGVYAGAGGGGGGSLDRTTPGVWNGGAGADGFCEITAPPQAGSGSLAQNNSSYNASALSASGAVGGGYTGGTGVVGGGYNGSGVRAAQY